jgi:hypothetical protein
MYTSLGKAAFRGLAQILNPESDGENSSHDSPLTSYAILELLRLVIVGLEHDCAEASEKIKHRNAPTRSILKMKESN